MTDQAAASGTEAVASGRCLHTVGGVISPAVVGKVLAHEHLYVNFLGPSDPRYLVPVSGFEAAIAVIAPYVEAVRAQGVDLIVDWGAVGVGRSVATLQAVSARTGVHVIAPTGIYKNLRPEKFAHASVEELTAWMIAELTDGIGDSGVTAGFVKIAADDRPSAGEHEIHRAAARAAAATGASLCCHLPFPLDAGDGSAGGRRVIDLVRGEGLALERFVWGHAAAIVDADGVNLDSGLAQHVELVEQGATVQYDVEATTSSVVLELVARLVALGYGNRVMIDNDASLYVNPGGGPAGELAAAEAARGLGNRQYPRDMRYLYENFVPLLVARIGEAAADQILRETPLRIFSRP